MKRSLRLEFLIALILIILIPSVAFGIQFIIALIVVAVVDYNSCDLNWFFGCPDDPDTGGGGGGGGGGGVSITLAAPTCTLATASPIQPGGSATWNASASDGTSPYTYAWATAGAVAPDDGNTSDSSLTMTYPNPGRHSDTTVRFQDSASAISASATCPEVRVAYPGTFNVDLYVKDYSPASAFLNDLGKQIPLGTANDTTNISIIVGHKYKIGWNLENAENCTATSGSFTPSDTSGVDSLLRDVVSPTTFTLTCQDINDSSQTVSNTVTVTPKLKPQLEEF